jgi:hypothetical protein
MRIKTITSQVQQPQRDELVFPDLLAYQATYSSGRIGLNPLVESDSCWVAYGGDGLQAADQPALDRKD